MSTIAKKTPRAMPTRSPGRPRKEDPPVLVDQEEDAESPIRLGVRLRHARIVKGLRLKDVADRSGFSESLISKIETNKATPSINTLHRIAKVLGTSSAELLSDASAVDKVVQSVGERLVMDDSSSMTGVMEGSDGTVAEVLIPFGTSRMLEAFIIRIRPGGSSNGLRTHDGEEVGYVMCGAVTLTVSGKTYQLKTGDSFHYASTLPHGFVNTGKDTCEIVWVNTPPSL